MKAKKHLGQHFLIDHEVIARILETIKSEWERGRAIAEVGPGTGVLTVDLAEHFEKFKAIEFDRDMVRLLKDKIDPDDLSIQYFVPDYI